MSVLRLPEGLFHILATVLVLGCQSAEHPSGSAQTSALGASSGEPSSTSKGPPTTSAPSTDPARAQSPSSDPAILADDLHHIDLGDLVSQAKAVAAEVDPRLDLAAIHAEEVVAGTIDVTARLGATYTFEYEGRDASQPPGKDEISMGLWVSARHGQLSKMRLPRAIHARPNGGIHVLPAPCPSRKAWSAAVASGVPENAVAAFNYGLDFGTRRPVWDIVVRGHSELNRSIDAASCKLLQDKAPGTANPSSAGGAAGVRDPWSTEPRASGTPQATARPRQPVIIEFPKDPYPQ